LTFDADEVFDGAAQRSEQRKWGGVYLRGLMLEGRRKSSACSSSLTK
jgi:hypothetical protein